jgi:DNA-binding FrmR family transcriptional regulator
MTQQLRDEARRRLARISGQVSGIQKMVDSDRACGDILQQIVAVRAALDHVAVSFLSEHLQTCVLHQSGADDAGCCAELPMEQRSDEIKSTLKRFLK